MIGRKIFDFFKDEDQKELRKQVTKVPSTKYRTYELPIQKKGGEVLHALFNATTLPMIDGMKKGSFSMITDMTEQKKLTEKLLSSNKELKESQKATLNILEDLSKENEERRNAEKEKDLEMNRAELYLDLLGHDIGNLHQGIDGWLAIAKVSVDNKTMLNKALDSSKRLTEETLRLVKNVLMLSRLKDVERIEEDIDLVKIVKGAIDNAEAVFSNTVLNIDLKCDEKNINIHAEKIISEVVSNLFHNSIKFQGLKKAVLEVGLRKDEKDKKVILDIADHGPGIPDEQKRILFKRAMTPQKKAHTGIGLMLVNALVERYNGSIRVEDRVKGDRSMGARFIIELPLS